MSLYSVLILSLVLDTVVVEKFDKISDIDEYRLEDVQKYFSVYRIEYGFQPYEILPSYEDFVRNIEDIIVMNRNHTSARFGINEFSRMGLETFTLGYTGFNDTGLNNNDLKDFVYADVSDPSYLTNNIVWLGPTAKHQVYGCKVSYAFSAVALIESAIYHKFGDYRVLSMQQGFDCEEEGSCRYGGLPHLVLESYKSIKGILTEELYPYQNMSYTYKKNCRQNLELVNYMVAGVDRLNVKDEVGLMGAVYIHGPLVTAIYVSNEVKNYQSGVLDPTDCDQPPNHAVLLVGYGKGNENVPYWHIKNSWGTKWGQQGYLRLVRGKRACNIGSYVVKVTVDAKNKTNTHERAPIIMAPVVKSTLKEAISKSLTQTIEIETTTQSLNLSHFDIPEIQEPKSNVSLRANENIELGGSDVKVDGIDTVADGDREASAIVTSTTSNMGNTKTRDNNTLPVVPALEGNDAGYVENFGNDKLAGEDRDVSSSNPEADHIREIKTGENNTLPVVHALAGNDADYDNFGNDKLAAEDRDVSSSNPEVDEIR